MKKCLIAAAAVLSLCGLAACGDNVEEPRTSDPGAYSGGTGATGSPGNPGTTAPGAPGTGSGSMSGTSSDPASPGAGTGPDMGDTGERTRPAP